MKHFELRLYLLFSAITILNTTYSQSYYFGEYVDTNVIESTSSLHISKLNDFYISYLTVQDELCVKRKNGDNWLPLNNSTKIIDVNVKQQTLLGNNNSDSLYLVYIDDVLPDRRLCVKMYDGSWHPTAEFILPEIYWVTGFVAKIDTITNTVYILLDQSGGNYYFLKYDPQTNSLISLGTPPLDNVSVVNRGDIIFNPNDGYIYCTIQTPSGITLYVFNGTVWYPLIYNVCDFISTSSYSKIAIDNLENKILIYYMALDDFGNVLFGLKSLNLQTMDTETIISEYTIICEPMASMHFGINPKNNVPYYCIKTFGPYHLNYILNGNNPTTYSTFDEYYLYSLSHDTSGFLYYTKIQNFDFSNYLVVRTFGEEVLETGENNKTSNNILVYPNPSSGTVNIQMQDDIKSHLIYAEVYDLFGKLLKKEQLSENKHSITLHELPAGSYILRIISDEIEFIEKITVL